MGKVEERSSLEVDKGEGGGGGGCKREGGEGGKKAKEGGAFLE